MVTDYKDLAKHFYFLGFFDDRSEGRQENKKEDRGKEGLFVISYWLFRFFSE